MFKFLPRALAFALLFVALAVPVSAQAAEGGNSQITSSQAQVVRYQLWVREIRTNERWWLWNTYTYYSDAAWIAHYFEQYGYDTYISPVTVYSTKPQFILPLD